MLVRGKLLRTLDHPTLRLGRLGLLLLLGEELGDLAFDVGVDVGHAGLDLGLGFFHLLLESELPASQLALVDANDVHHAFDAGHVGRQPLDFVGDDGGAELVVALDVHALEHVGEALGQLVELELEGLVEAVAGGYVRRGG